MNLESLSILNLIDNGGKGSGNHGHCGRQGVQGGSGPCVGKVSDYSAKVAEAIQSSGIAADNIRQLYGSDPEELSYALEDLLGDDFQDRVLKPEEIEELKQYFREKSLKAAKAKGIEFPIHTYRGESERDTQETISVTREKRIAEFHKGQQVQEKNQPRRLHEQTVEEADVLFWSGMSTGTYEEDEWIVKRKPGILALNGGKGSGNHGHCGRPGKVGGASKNCSTSKKSKPTKGKKKPEPTRGFKWKTSMDSSGGSPVFTHKSNGYEVIEFPQTWSQKGSTTLFYKGAQLGSHKSLEAAQKYAEKHSSRQSSGGDQFNELLRKGKKSKLFEDHYFGTSEYKQINDSLRAGEPSEEAKKLVTEFKKKAIKLPTDMVVYRKVKGTYKGKTGSIEEHKGFTSTTASKDYVKEFNPHAAENGGFGKRGKATVLEIKIPKGTAVFPHSSDEHSEFELLLEPGTKFKTVGKNKLQVVSTKSKITANDLLAINGGPGSGNFGHCGRPGQVGGAGECTGKSEKSKPTKTKKNEEEIQYAKVHETATKATTHKQTRYKMTRSGNGLKLLPYPNEPDVEYNVYKATVEAGLDGESKRSINIGIAKQPSFSKGAQGNAEEKFVAEVNQVLEVLPREIIEEAYLTNVILGDPDAFAEGVGGFYSPSTGAIQINPKYFFDDDWSQGTRRKGFSSAQDILIHEIGHAVDASNRGHYSQNDKSDQKRISEFPDVRKALREEVAPLGKELDPPITFYAYTNPEEAFAEWFRYTIHFPKSSKERFPKMWQALEDTYYLPEDFGTSDNFVQNEEKEYPKIRELFDAKARKKMKSGDLMIDPVLPPSKDKPTDNEEGMEQFILNAVNTRLIRHEELEDKQYLVLPMVMITHGVHRGSNGPLYYPETELNKTPSIWNGRPIVVYHPKKNGQGISAGDPHVFNTAKIGVVMNTIYKDGKLKAEAWIDPVKADKVDKRIMQAIRNGDKLEISTGVFVDQISNNGKFGDKPYNSVAINYRPDHLAVLPDTKGACSVADGCGLLANESTMAGGTPEDEDEDMKDCGCGCNGKGTCGKGNKPKNASSESKRSETKGILQLNSLILHGGDGSGNHGHCGRKGQQGGSGPCSGGGGAKPTKAKGSSLDQYEKAVEKLQIGKHAKLEKKLGTKIGAFHAATMGDDLKNVADKYGIPLKDVEQYKKDNDKLRAQYGLDTPSGEKRKDRGAGKATRQNAILKAARQIGLSGSDSHPDYDKVSKVLGSYYSKLDTGRNPTQFETDVYMAYQYGEKRQAGKPAPTKTPTKLPTLKAGEVQTVKRGENIPTKGDYFEFFAGHKKAVGYKFRNKKEFEKAGNETPEGDALFDKIIKKVEAKTGKKLKRDPRTTRPSFTWYRDGEEMGAG